MINKASSLFCCSRKTKATQRRAASACRGDGLDAPPPAATALARQKSLARIAMRLATRRRRKEAAGALLLPPRPRSSSSVLVSLLARRAFQKVPVIRKILITSSACVELLLLTRAAKRWARKNFASFREKEKLTRLFAEQAHRRRGAKTLCFHFNDAVKEKTTSEAPN